MYDEGGCFAIREILYRDSCLSRTKGSPDSFVAAGELVTDEGSGGERRQQA